MKELYMFKNQEPISEVTAPLKTIFPKFSHWLDESLAAGELCALEELFKSDERISSVLDNLEGVIHRAAYGLLLGYYLAKQEQSSQMLEHPPPTATLH
jgi:hypothetical protein